MPSGPERDVERERAAQRAAAAEREAAEHEAVERAAEAARVRNGLEHPVLANFVADPGGRVIAGNQRFHELCGVCEEGGTLELSVAGPARLDWPQLVAELRAQDALPFRVVTLHYADFNQEVVATLWADKQADGTVLRVHGSLLDSKARGSLEALFGHAKQLEYVSQIAGELAHDFNNLLTIILSVSELMLMSGELSSTLTRRARSVVSASQRAASLTTQLLALSRRRGQSWPVIVANQLVHEALVLLRRVVPEVEITTHETPQECPVQVDTVQIEQVLVSLVLHVRDALLPGDGIAIRTRRIVLSNGHDHGVLRPGEYALVCVGEANALSELDAAGAGLIARSPGEGGRTSGLGLTSASGVVRFAGGHLDMDRPSGRPPLFFMYLPIVGGSPAAALSTPRAAAPAEYTILVAEDEELVRQLTCMLLRELGYTVLEAPDGLAALNLARQHTGPIHLLLTDVMMPRMGGVELGREIKQLFPGVQVLYMSGHSEDTLIQQGLARREAHLLAKPFTQATLASAVRRMLPQGAESAHPLN